MRKLLSVMLVLVMLLTQLAIPSFANVGDFDGVGDIFEDEWVDPYAGLEVKSITVEAQSQLIENYDGYYEINEDDEEIFIYDIDYADLWFTVVYENGEEENCEMYDLYEGVFYDDYQYENPWGLGKHEINGTYRDAEFSVEVEVVETPVASVTAVAQNTLVEGWDAYESYYYDDEGNEIPYLSYSLYDTNPVFTITMKDGTVFTGTDEEIYEQTGDYTFEQEDQYANPLKVGKNTIIFSYLGTEGECEIEIIPNPYESITISGENELVIEFKGVDEKDSYKTKAVSWSGYVDECEAWGFIITEDGKELMVDYYCAADDDGNLLLNKEVSLKVGPFTTNTLKTNNWLLAYVTAENVYYYTMSYRMVNENFTGYFSEEEKNIDDLVAISTFVCEMEPEENEECYVHTLKVSEVEENIEAVFGLTDVDVKKSSYYNRLKNRVVIEEPFDNGVYGVLGSFTYEEGQWISQADSYYWETDEFAGEMVVIINGD